MTRAKEIWDAYAADEAYFAVLSEDRFRRENFDTAARAEFFKSGHDHIGEVWSALETAFDVRLKPRRSLDFGCGVGRLLIPIAERSESAVGVDISQKMLDEAKRNVEAARGTVVALQSGDEFAVADGERYSLVHTYIVLQHIHPRYGYGIIEKMLERLEPGGCGMIHLTYKNTNRSFSRVRADIYRDYPIVHRTLNALRGRSEPIMPMYEYHLPQVLEIFDKNGCGERFERETNHDGILGRMIFFKKDNPN